MAYSSKTWKNRVSEYGNRRTLTDTSTGTEQVVTVARNEGTVSEEGDAFNATNMNDLESRISNALDSGKSFLSLSKSEYDAISTKDPNTIYLIKG